MLDTINTGYLYIFHIKLKAAILLDFLHLKRETKMWCITLPLASIDSTLIMWTQIPGTQYINAKHDQICK